MNILVRAVEEDGDKYVEVILNDGDGDHLSLYLDYTQADDLAHDLSAIMRDRLEETDG